MGLEASISLLELKTIIKYVPRVSHKDAQHTTGYQREEWNSLEVQG